MQKNTPHTDIDTMLDEQFEASQEEQTALEPFRIDSLGKATWAVRKMKTAQERIEERLAFAQQEIERIQEWVKVANAEDHRTIEHMTHLLKPYAREQLEDSRKKSLDVPGARLSFGAQQPEIQTQDDTILAWVIAGGYSDKYARTKTELLWGELKKDCSMVDEYLIAPTGEVVPGVTLIPRPDAFRVKLK